MGGGGHYHTAGTHTHTHLLKMYLKPPDPPLFLKCINCSRACGPVFETVIVICVSPRLGTLLAHCNVIGHFSKCSDFTIINFCHKCCD